MLLVVLVTCALIVISLITVLNVVTFPRLDRFAAPNSLSSDVSLVSILIPARNEAANIGNTLRDLLNQDYARFEVIVLDDHSTDETAQAARAAAQGDPRVRVLSGAELPSGWLGKNWACHQLAQAAQGDLLLFTDADVRWSPGALRALIALSHTTRADLVTVWPTQITETWGERLTVPLMALVIIGYLPALAAHFIPWPAFAAANGQCLLFRRPAYDKVGGHAAVKHSIVEDIQLSRRVKAQGLRLRMADGAGLIACRMYRGWRAVRDGYAKNILAGYGGRVTFLLLASVFHWLIFFAPWVWLALGWIAPTWPGAASAVWPAWPLALVVLSVGVRATSAAVTRQRIADALLMPVSVILMTRIAWQAIWWQWRYGGPQWKGRTLVSKGA